MEEQNIDRLIKQALQEEGLNKPSDDFLKNTMQFIHQEVKTSEKVYQPLISRESLGFLVFVVLFFTIVAVFWPSTDVSRLETLWAKMHLSELWSASEVQISTRFLSAIICFCILLLANNYFIGKQWLMKASVGR